MPARLPSSPTPQPFAGVRPAASQAARSVTTAVLGAKVTTPAAYFAQLKSLFLPDKAQGVTATYQFEISGDDGGTWHVIIKNGKLIKVASGKTSKPTATMKTKDEQFVKLVHGDVSALTFILGRVKAEGDSGAMRKFRDYFKEL